MFEVSSQQPSPEAVKPSDKAKQSLSVKHSIYASGELPMRHVWVTFQLWAWAEVHAYKAGEAAAMSMGHDRVLAQIVHVPA